MAKKTIVKPPVRLEGPLTEKDTKGVNSLPFEQRREYENWLREKSAISTIPKKRNLDWDMTPTKKIQLKGGTTKMKKGGAVKAEKGKWIPPWAKNAKEDKTTPKKKVVKKTTMKKK